MRRISGKQNGYSRSGDDELLHIMDKVWISNHTEKLKIRTLIIVHAGQAEHKGSEATSAPLSEAPT